MPSFHSARTLLVAQTLPNTVYSAGTVLSMELSSSAVIPSAPADHSFFNFPTAFAFGNCWGVCLNLIFAGSDSSDLIDSALGTSFRMI